MMIGKVVLLIVTAIAASAADEGNNNVVSGNSCQSCRSLVALLTHYKTFVIEENPQHYKDAFNSFCEQYYPVSFSDRQSPCSFFTEGIFYAMDKIDPNSYCDRIGACDEPHIFKVAPGVQGDNKGGGCEVCQKVVIQIQRQLKNPKIIAGIYRQVDALCGHARPIREDKQCRAMLDRHIEKAINYIEKLNPIRFCQSIHLTKTPTKAALLPSVQASDIEISSNKVAKSIFEPTRKASPNGLGPLCFMCTTVVHELFRFVNTTQAEVNVRNGLDRVCRYVYHEGPKFVQCETMVQAHSKQLEKLLVEGASAELICMMLALCLFDEPSSKTILDETWVPVEPIDLNQLASKLEPINQMDRKDMLKLAGGATSGGSVPVCAVCTTTIGILLRFVNETQVELNLRHDLDRLCQYVYHRGPKFQRCEEIVKANAQKLEQLLLEQASPQLICAMLEFCPYDVRLGETIMNNEVVGPSAEMFAAFGQSDLELGSVRDCVECKLFIKYLKRTIEEPKSKESTENWLLTNVCDQMEAPKAKDACTSMVANYADISFKILAKYLEPKRACAKLHACKKTNLGASQSAIDSLVQPPVAQKKKRTRKNIYWTYIRN